MNLKIEKTNLTPFVHLKQGLIELNGKSVPENPHAFYDPIINWITRYITNPAKFTEVKLSLEYLNSNSCIYIFKILQILQNSYNEGNAMAINWYCEEDDEIMIGLANDYKTLLEIPFNVILS